MKEAVLFYSDLCPDTGPFVEQLDAYQIAYTALNITSSLSALKQFIQLRETRREFDDKRQQYQLGIPVLVTSEGTILFDVAMLDDYITQ